MKKLLLNAPHNPGIFSGVFQNIESETSTAYWTLRFAELKIGTSTVYWDLRFAVELKIAILYIDWELIKI